MPVDKISDAPANIKELDGAKLTLAQINWILRVYDALKEKGKVKSPMAVAISQFKKSYKKAGDKWVKKEQAASAGMVDIDRLDRYHIVLTGNTAPDQVTDLRELDGDFGPGVYLLWSDEKQSVIAFAFEPAFYSEQEAQEWVRQAIEEPTKASALTVTLEAVTSAFTAALDAVVKALGRGESHEGKGLRGFSEIRRLVSQAINDKYPSTDGDWPWIIDIGTTRAIVEIQGQRYAISYTIADDKVVSLSEPELVEEAWIRGDGLPVTLHAFDVQLGDGEEAEEDDGLVWKELIHPGKWFKTDSGNVLEITKEMVAEVYCAWKAGLPKLISVPTDSHHDRTGGIVPVESNRGFVQKLKLIGDKLFGGFKFTDPEVSYGVQVGNIADCSVYLQPSLIHPETGEQFDWALEHVLLTNAPLVQDLGPFGALPIGASADGQEYVVQSYQQVQEVNEMSEEQVIRTAGTGPVSPVLPPRDEGDKGPVVVESKAQTRSVSVQSTPPDGPVEPGQGVTLSAAEAGAFQAFQGLGLTVDDVQAMVVEREQVRRKARDLEISHIVRALEGLEEHEGVVQVDGTRHWPVVCAAVEKALREYPQALALSANEEGRTGVDVVVLDLVNAIPADGRMALEASDQPTGVKEHDDPTLNAGTEKAVPTDEQLDEAVSRWT